jgi:hypothetical protein
VQDKSRENIIAIFMAMSRDNAMTEKRCARKT